MVTTRVLLFCWLGLVALSVTSVQLGNAKAGLLLAAAILLAALGKAWLIADGFMHLRNAPPVWRGLLLSWAVVMAVVLMLSIWLQRTIGS